MGEELLSIPKLVFVNEENIQRVVTVESKETKLAGRSKKRNSDDLSRYCECEKCNKKYKSDVVFRLIGCIFQNQAYQFHEMQCRTYNFYWQKVYTKFGKVERISLWAYVWVSQFIFSVRFKKRIIAQHFP